MNEVVWFAATWVQLEIITLSEVRQTPTPHDIAYLWNLNCDSKEPVWNAERRTDPEDRLAAAQGRGVGRRMEWGSRGQRVCAVTCRRENQPRPMDGTENYIQYPVMNHSGKEHKTECVYLSIYINWMYKKNVSICKLNQFAAHLK